MFALFLLWQATKSSARTIYYHSWICRIRRLRRLRQLNQQLWIFAAFGDAFLRK